VEYLIWQIVTLAHPAVSLGKLSQTLVPEARAPEACGVEAVVLCALVQVPDVRACEACGGEAVMLCGAIRVAIRDPCGGVG
jgi:hypothetical protein